MINNEHCNLFLVNYFTYRKEYYCNINLPDEREIVKLIVVNS